MAKLIQIEGVDKLVEQLKARMDKHAPVDGVVGYTASYAIFVHENLEAHHPVGQAKFLEQPMRELRGEMQAIVKNVVRAGGTLKEAVTAALLFLQAASQELVPVDTGALKGSAFTRVE